MTKLENKIIKSLINNHKIKFHCRYVDKLLNGSDKNLQFTVNLFENKVPRCLDLEMSPDGISIYQKSTNTGLSVKYTSFAL